MRILITNDDGISAPGLDTLHHIATRLTDTPEDVWTVAPAFEQSGVGHCISYSKPMMVQRLSDRLIACEGSPADCVLAGVHEFMRDAPPDLILSGVNRGNNSAENALYSGTLGAAIEGALQGITSIGLSQYFGPRNRDLDDPFETARDHGETVIRRILETLKPQDAGYKLFFNVNFPPVASAEVSGIRVVSQGLRPGTGFHTEATQAPNGRKFLWIKGGDQQVATAPDTDAAVNLDGFISVTPMRADLTDHAAVRELQGIAT